MRGFLRSRRAMRQALMAPLFVAMSTSASCVIGIFDEDGTLRDNRHEAQASFSIEVPVQNQHRLRVEAINGFIHLRTTPNLQVITVTGTRIVGAESRSVAQRRLSDLAVVVDELPNDVLLRTQQPRDAQGRRYEVEYTILIPESFEVDLDQVNGFIDVEGPIGSTEATNVNGTVHVRRMSEAVDLTVVNGNVEADLDRVGGAVDISTTNGNVDLRVPSSSSASLLARVTNGSITLSGLSLSNQTVTSRSLEGTLGSGQHSIHLTTVNGNVSIGGN